MLGGLVFFFLDFLDLDLLDVSDVSCVSLLLCFLPVSAAAVVGVGGAADDGVEGTVDVLGAVEVVGTGALEGPALEPSFMRADGPAVFCAPGTMLVPVCRRKVTNSR